MKPHAYLLLFLTLILTATAHAQSTAGPAPNDSDDTLNVGALEGTYPMLDPQRISAGRGYNRFTGAVMTSPFVARQAGTTNSSKYGQVRRYTMMRVVDFKELHSSKGGDAASGGNFFGLIDVRASAAYSNKVDTSTLTETVLIRLDVTNWPTDVDAEELTTAARGQLLTAPKNFYARYGTEYISELATGGAFFEMRTYNVQTEKQKRIFTSAMGGGFLDFGEAEASFAQTVDALRVLQRSRSAGSAVGGVAPGPQETATTEGFQAFAQRFAESVKPGSGNERPLAFRTRSYTSVEPDFDEEPLRRAVGRFNELQRQRTELGLALRSFQEAQAVPSLYCSGDVLLAADRERANREAAKRVDARMSALSAQPYKQPPPALVDLGNAASSVRIRPDVPADLKVWYRSTTVVPTLNPNGVDDELTFISPGGVKSDDLPWFGNMPIGRLALQKVDFLEPTPALQLEYNAKVWGQRVPGMRPPADSALAPSVALEAVQFQLVGPLADSYEIKCKALKWRHPKGSYTPVQTGPDWCGSPNGGNNLGRLAVWVEPKPGIETCAARDAMTTAAQGR